MPTFFKSLYNQTILLETQDTASSDRSFSSRAFHSYSE